MFKASQSARGEIFLSNLEEPLVRISVNNGLFLSSAQADDKNSRSEFMYLLTQKITIALLPLTARSGQKYV